MMFWLWIASQVQSGIIGLCRKKTSHASGIRNVGRTKHARRRRARCNFYGLTFCDTTPDVLVVKSKLPPYTAVIESVPSASVDVANVALPALSVPVPSVVVPFLNVTVPAGVPTPGATAVTVAVNVTVVPDVEGFNEDAIVVLVLALSTTWDSTADVLVA